MQIIGMSRPNFKQEAHEPNKSPEIHFLEINMLRFVIIPPTPTPSPTPPTPFFDKFESPSPKDILCQGPVVLDKKIFESW